MSGLFVKRLSLLRKALSAKNVAALLVTHPPNVFYLCGFSGDSGTLLMDQQRTWLFTDGRFTVQARQELQIDARLVISPGTLANSVGEIVSSRRMKVGFEAGHMTVAQMKVFRQAAGAKPRWVALSGTVEALRAIKDVNEIERIRDAGKLASRTLAEVLALLKPGIREFEVAAEIEYRMRRRGADGPAFKTIVAFGARAALPHARPTGKRLRKNELVVLDLGAILAGYCSDLTRTVYVGKASARIRKWYDAVRQAQAAAIAATRAGALAGDVDGAARHVLAGARLEKYFVHSTGHGLGLEVHEDPRLARNQKHSLHAGNVVTIEPGVYVEGIGGIRIEDDVAVYADRTEVLTDAPRDFLEL
jgi:Xaa-Pro aminopeptidase